MTLFYTSKAPGALSFALALVLGACTTTGDRYPSLAKRDAERDSGALQPVSPDAAAPATVQPDAQLNQNLQSLRNAGAEAHGEFLAALPEIRTTVEGNTGAEMGSDGWFVAQTAISGLESQRGRTMTALAELDRLYIAAQLEGGAREAIGAVQQEVETMVLAENTQIAELLGQLGQ